MSGRRVQWGPEQIALLRPRMTNLLKGFPDMKPVEACRKAMREVLSPEWQRTIVQTQNIPAILLHDVLVASGRKEAPAILAVTPTQAGEPVAAPTGSALEAALVRAVTAGVVAAVPAVLQHPAIREFIKASAQHLEVTGKHDDPLINSDAVAQALKHNPAGTANSITKPTILIVGVKPHHHPPLEATYGKHARLRFWFGGDTNKLRDKAVGTDTIILLEGSVSDYHKNIIMAERRHPHIVRRDNNSIRAEIDAFLVRWGASKAA